MNTPMIFSQLSQLKICSVKDYIPDNRTKKQRYIFLELHFWHPLQKNITLFLMVPPLGIEPKSQV